MKERFPVMIILAAIILFVGFSFAAQPAAVYASVYFHGDFASSAKSCDSCHRVHFAETESLLSHGSNETEFCYYCHGDSSGENSSGYNVQSGLVTVGNESKPSNAGGFDKSIDPSRSDSENMVFDNTSVHSVEGAHRLGQLSELKDGDIPGGGTWQGSFKCGSCHDPHSGGQYPDTPYKNPRLLRNRLLDDVQRYVYMSIDYGNTNLSQAYGAGFNQWCGGCHDVFNTEGTGERTGSTGFSNGSMIKFRHKVGVNIPDQVFSTDLATGLPIPTDTKGNGIGTPQWRLDCMTCHRAHGSSVNVSIGFERFKEYNSVSGYEYNENQSALLRLPERGVCVRCHGSAQYNKYNGDYSAGW